MSYSEKQYAEALEAVWDALEALEGCDYDTVDRKTLMEKYPILHEINEFGAQGPVGLGLGKFGGHAIE